MARRRDLYLRPASVATIAICSALLGLLASRVSGTLAAVEMRLYDWRVRISATEGASPDIIIIGIDDATMSAPDVELWGPNSLHRRHYTDALGSLSNAGVRAIGVDVAMTRPSPEDGRLAEAISRAGNVVLVADATAEISQARTTESFGFELPPEPLSSAARFVASPLVARPDNVVRFFHPWQSTADGTRMFPALATGVALTANQASGAGAEDPGRASSHAGEQPRWIRWPRTPPGFKIVPMLDLLRGEVAPETLSGTIALIGRWDSMEDTLQTPLGDMPGVAIHACATASMLSDPWLTRPWPLSLLLSVVAPALIGLAASRGSLVRVVGAAAGLVLAVLAAAALAFKLAGVWIEILPASLSCLLAAVVLGGAQSELARAWVPAWLYAEPEEVDGTVLVCDIRGYTSRSETEAPASVMEDLSSFFAVVERVVSPHGGFSGRRPGDAAIVLFRDEGGGRQADDHAVRALRAAIDLRAALVGLAVEFQAKGKVPLETGTTVVSGRLSVGVLGSRQLELQFVGDPLNVAFRLQEYARDHALDLVVAHSTLRQLPDASALREIGETQVRGRSESVRLYTLD